MACAARASAAAAVVVLRHRGLARRPGDSCRRHCGHGVAVDLLRDHDAAREISKVGMAANQPARAVARATEKTWLFTWEQASTVSTPPRRKRKEAKKNKCRSQSCYSIANSLDSRRFRMVERGYNDRQLAGDV